jgi:hypothetical protein
VCLLIGGTTSAAAQTLLDRIVIRQNLDSKKDVAKPAFANVMTCLYGAEQSIRLTRHVGIRE